MVERIAACPLLWRRGSLWVVLVTTRRGGRWTLPKGNLEEDLSNPQVAELEAYEEAGIIGRAHGPGGRAMVRSRGRLVATEVYALVVHQLLSRWPEDGERQRRLVRVDRLEEIPLDPTWCWCIRRLASQPTLAMAPAPRKAAHS